MKQKLFFMLLLLALSMNLCAQNDSIVRVTKYSALETKKGVVIKFVDKNIDDIKYNASSFGLPCKIRTFHNNEGNSYFVIISSTQKKAMIEYSDLVEVNKAFEKLFKEVDSDCSLDPDYLENKYITDDGFKIGYYVRKGKAHWYFDLDFYSIGGYFDLKKPYDFSKGLKEAQNEIEKMKKNK